MLLLLQVVKRNSVDQQILLCIFLFLVGVASNFQSLSAMVIVTEVTDGIERKHPGIFGEKGGTGQAYGLFSVAWSGGQVIGPLVAGYLVEQQGWTAMVTVFSGATGVMAVILGLTKTTMLTEFWRRKEGNGEVIPR